MEGDGGGGDKTLEDDGRGERTEKWVGEGKEEGG